MADYVLKGRIEMDTTEATKDIKKMTNSAKASFTTTGRDLTRSFGGLAGIIGRAFAIGAAFELQMAIRGTITEVARLTAELDRVEAGTAQLSAASGMDLRTVAEATYDAAEGTITWAEALRQVNQSLLLGGTDIVENLPELFEIARVNARAMGIDVERALESMVTGLGRVSPRWLDNLGIIIDTRQAYQDMADQMGVTVGSLTEADQRLALINAILEKYGPLAAQAAESNMSLAESWEAITASTASVAAELGTMLVEASDLDIAFENISQHISNIAERLRNQRDLAGYLDTAEQLRDAWNEIDRTVQMVMGTDQELISQEDWLITDDQIDAMVEHVKRGNEEIAIDLANRIAGVLASVGADISDITLPFGAEEGLQIDEEAIREQNRLLAVATDNLKSFLTAVEQEGVRAFKLMREEGVSLSEALGDVNYVVEAVQTSMKDLLGDEEFINSSVFEQSLRLQDILEDLKSEVDLLDGSEINIGITFEDYQDELLGGLKALYREGLPYEEMQRLRKEGEQFRNMTEMFGFDQLDPLDQWVLMEGQMSRVLGEGEAIVQNFKDQEDAAKKAALEWERAYKRAIQNIRSDVETVALMGLDVKPEDFLAGYEDAPLESVRRLRDIVNLGTESPWIDFFDIPQEAFDQGEDAIKRWALDMANRGAGLRDISLIDKDAFLRELADLKLARQETAATIDQLVRWAMEAGLVSTEQEARALVSDKLSGPEGAFAKGMEDGIKQYDPTKTMTSEWKKNTEKDETKKQFNDIGRGVADQVVGGFRERLGEINFAGLFPTMPGPDSVTGGELP